MKSIKFQGLSSSLIKRFAVQMLAALVLLDQNNIIHCDLKPENILLKNRSQTSIKVIDFGSSCFEDKRLYTYIQSRFYRAPEIILGIPYSTKIDVWSFGCILAELHTGYPLFPGESEAEQLLCIMEVMGVPSSEVLSLATRTELFFKPSGEPKIQANSRGKERHPNGKDLDQILKGAEPGLIDLVKKCLEWDPGLRISPKQALSHDWLLSTDKPERLKSSQHQTSTPKHSRRQSAD